MGIRSLSEIRCVCVCVFREWRLVLLGVVVVGGYGDVGFFSDETELFSSCIRPTHQIPHLTRATFHPTRFFFFPGAIPKQAGYSSGSPEDPQRSRAYGAPERLVLGRLP